MRNGILFCCCCAVAAAAAAAALASAFVKSLAAAENVLYCSSSKSFCFLNPFEAIQTADALHKTVQMRGPTGLRLDSSFMAGCSSALSLVNCLLVERRVRAVRTTNAHKRGKSRCLRLGPSGDSTCDLYDKKKCSNCYKNICCLILYPTGDAAAEDSRFKIDKE
ncbi:hypothetical protein, conserved, partial [Eimeria tenella]